MENVKVNVGAHVFASACKLEDRKATTVMSEGVVIKKLCGVDCLILVEFEDGNKEWYILWKTIHEIEDLFGGCKTVYIFKQIDSSNKIYGSIRVEKSHD